MGAETLGSLDAIVQLLVEYGAPIDALNKVGTDNASNSEPC